MKSIRLSDIYSHPRSKKYPNGKLLTVHIEHVKEKAQKKYFGPDKFIKYIELTSVFHDIGKSNPNFQDYLFSNNKKGFENKYKNHSYLSFLTLVTLIIYNKELFLRQYEIGLLGLLLVLIAKHHGNLPDILSHKDVFNQDEINKVRTFFFKDKTVAKQYINIVNEYTKFFKFTFKDLKIEDFTKQIFFKANDFLERCISTIDIQKKLEYFLLTQYIFSCVIEADKRDAGDNDLFLLENELKAFNPRYFADKLHYYYSSFKERGLKSEQKSLNEVRTEIKNTCVKNVRKFVQSGERMFQIVAPTGSGKTLTFLSVAKEIKNQNPEKDLKVIYVIPFLSITDQIARECEKVFNDQSNLIYRIDSAGKTINEETEIKLEQLADQKDSELDLNEQLILKDFAENTFDHAFIVTTFVKLFETLTANRNKDLLRFNNFSKSIIIVDEIQSLPPRTYTFLIALLSKYVNLFDSYLVIGSATVPMFEFPESEKSIIKELNGVKVNIRKLFRNYKAPLNLLDDYEYKYKNKNFCRYKVTFDENPQKLQELAARISKDKMSTLCILNTKRSSLDLFELINKKKKNVFLLNTMQTLKDRQYKLDIVKEKLKNKEEIYLISTQLIEAGIDISFPKVYRDLAPFPSIIQAAGRCNRNREIEVGETIVINLVDEKERSYSSMIYKDLMDFTQSLLHKFSGNVNESELLAYQKSFFEYIKDKLEFGKYYLKYTDSIYNYYYLQHTIYNLEYEKISQFSLIENREFDLISVFIIQTKKDKKDFEEFTFLKNEPFDFSLRINVQNKMRGLSNRIVSVPANFQNNISLFAELKNRETFGISYIDANRDTGIEYSFERGLVIKNADESILI